MFDLDTILPENTSEEIILPLENSKISYHRYFLSEKKADFYFQKLMKDTSWQQDDITVFGKTYAQPRLTALYGEAGKPYTYSGITLNPSPFEDLHLEILEQLQSVTETGFTSVLLNLYRDGNDSNGWHADDEKELGKNPVIASISLGAKRYFQLKSKENPKQTYKISLHHGSLLLMEGLTQQYWLHQLPKSKKITTPRINLTFRKIEG